MGPRVRGAPVFTSEIGVRHGPTQPLFTGIGDALAAELETEMLDAVLNFPTVIEHARLALSSNRMTDIESGLRTGLGSRWRVIRTIWRSISRRAGRPHSLPGELVVSLTSFPARFRTLHLTLYCLLDQTVRPDRIVLWIAREDISALPRAVTKLQRRGLEIRACEDLRSYKKLVPALEAFPRAFIVTADDDLEFARDWLETLVEGASSMARAILCHRAHRSVSSSDGQFNDYLDWEFDVQDSRARLASTEIMATTGAGALFPPGALAEFVTDRTMFQRLCPDGDDLWFWWCARVVGTCTRKVGGVNRLFAWSGTEEVALWRVNRAGANDRMIRALSAELPDGLCVRRPRSS